MAMFVVKSIHIQINCQVMDLSIGPSLNVQSDLVCIKIATRFEKSVKHRNENLRTIGSSPTERGKFCPGHLMPDIFLCSK